MDHVFELPGGLQWVVRGREFPTEEEARLKWEETQAAARGKGQNFSLWRTTDPTRTINLLVLCGPVERLPDVGGQPFDIGRESAHAFALRRARVGADVEASSLGEGEHFEQEARYGENVQVIDPETGRTKPWQG